MTKRLTISPRYMDFRNAADAKAAFLCGTDFTSLAMDSHGLAVNLQDCQYKGVTDVTIRYRKSTQITTCEVPPMTADQIADMERDCEAALNAKIAYL